MVSFSANEDKKISIDTSGLLRKAERLSAFPRDDCIIYSRNMFVFVKRARASSAIDSLLHLLVFFL